jgi:HEAT repeat protein
MAVFRPTLEPTPALRSFTPMAEPGAGRAHGVSGEGNGRDAARRSTGTGYGERLMPDHIARRRAAAVAGHTGDVDLPRLLLDDEDPSVRATALGALARLDAVMPPEVQHALEDPDPAVRRRAAEVLAGAGGELDEVRLGPLLHDADDTVVETAAWAAGERLGRAAESGRPLPEPELVRVLAELATGHNDALCREAAVAALGSIGDEAGLPAILAATHDKATVRRRAVIALAPFDGPDVDAALERARNDRDWQVRQAAEDQLRQP